MHSNRISITVLFLVFCSLGSLMGASQDNIFQTAQIVLDKERKSPREIKFPEGKQPTVESFFQEYRDQFQLPVENQMQSYRVSTDRIGTHHRFNQHYKGLEILGAQFILHEKNGRVWYANGTLVPDVDANVVPAITEQDALEAALRHINAEEYMWQKPENEAFLKREQDDPNATFFPKGELKLTSGREELTARNIKLVYRFDVYAEKPLGRYYVDVDARTGEIVNKLDRIRHADLLGSGASLYNGTVPITVDQTGASSFRLQGNTTRGAAIRTFDMLNGTDYGAAVDFTSTTATGPWDATGVSTHYGAEATYDYFLSAHGRNSLDNSGFTLLSYAHYSSGYINAFWDGTRMTYGDGGSAGGRTFTPLVGLDVCGHELTHGVTEFSSDLIYQGESGALNESFSDIFGNLVEFYKEGNPGVGTGDWRIGDDITTDGLGIRNMANPNEFSDPDTYLGTHWASTTGPDNGGVHTNSGVQNFWFYLLSEGGSGTNDNGDAYTVVGIGIADAAAISYHNNNSFLTQGSDYDAARNGAVACAEALFGVGSQQALSTIDAWDAVGVDGIVPPAPANDSCANAIAVACGETVSGTTVDATLDAVGFCGTTTTAPGVWYTVVGLGADMTASTCDAADYDTKISVFTGPCGTLVCVGGLDDTPGCSGFTTSFTWPSTLGTTYYVLVHGFGGATGDFDLTVTCEIPAQIAAAPTQFDFTVPLNGTDSDQLTISNTAAAGGFDLDWTVSALEADNGSAIMRPKPQPARAKPHDDVIATYQITDNALDKLRAKSVPAEIISALGSLKDRQSTDKEVFHTAFSSLLGDTDVLAYQRAVFESAVRWQQVGVETKNKEVERKKPEVVPPAPMAAGGPDVFGYRWIDSDEPGGPSFSWTDISGSGTSVALGDDDFMLVSLPFTFPFYGVDMTDVRISSNGYLTFGTDGTDFSNDPIPDTNDPNDVICPFWDDLNPADGGTIHYLSNSTQFIVQYTAVPRFGGGSLYTFQVILNDDGSILYQYLDMQGNLSSATVGIENATGTVGTQVVHNAAYVHDDLAVLISRPLCTWLSAAPTSGSIPAGSSDQIDVSVDATGLSAGVYHCELWIPSNAANVNPLIVPVLLTVRSPVELIDDLIAKVQALRTAGVLNKGRANALISKLEAARKHVIKGRRTPAINELGAFINQVNAFISARILTAVQGQVLIDCANVIIDLLNSSTSSLAASGVGNASVTTAPLPTEFALNQNYPNPFNPATVIRYALPQSARVTIMVYDVLGRRVADLVNDEVAAGYHEVKFRPVSLASGIYFYRMEAQAEGGQTFTEVRKLMLIK